jgi:CPA1 family monovalent cation:H+ antiporter
MDQFLATETLIIELLLIVSLVAIAVRRLQVPYTVALVVAGLLITNQTTFQFELTPELILALFVPPLIFEAAFHINLRELQSNLSNILLLAIPGVVLTTVIVGGALSLVTPLPLPVTLVFGAMIAATDPVAVVALFRALGVPKRLALLIEGESLLNDGTAIVLFNLMLVIALTGQFNLVNSVGSFLRVALGGTVVGLVLGWLISRIIARVDDYLIETTLTTVLAFGAYLTAEQLHFSGVLAVVAAGIINGNIGPQGMSPSTRIVLFNFWEYFAFLANSLIFLLIGLQVNIPALIADWQPILWAILVVLAARSIVVYSLGRIAKRFTEPIPLRWQHVLNWGGLRGAICLALGLSLPSSLGSDRDLLRVMVYGVVLFTLLVQSTSMKPLIRRLRIITRSEAQIEYELRLSRLTSLRVAETHLDRLHNDGLISTHTWERLKQYILQNASSLVIAVRELLVSDPALEAEELDVAWRELNRAQRGALLSLRRDGVISEEVFDKLIAEISAQLISGSPELPMNVDARVQFLDVIIPSGSNAIGKTVVELGLPRGAVLVSIRREGEILIPRGDTMFRAGDMVTSLCERDSIDVIKKILVSRNANDL